MDDREQIVRAIVDLFIEASSQEDILKRHNWIVDQIEKRVQIAHLTERDYEEELSGWEDDVEDGIAEYYCTQLDISFDLFNLRLQNIYV